MNNPLITYTINTLEIPDVVDIYKAILEYKKGSTSMTLTLYDESEEEDFFTLEDKIHPIDFTYNVDIASCCSIIENFTNISLTLGTDYKSLYDKDHRLVEYIRFVIPDGLFQIDYDDEQTALDTADTMYEFMRTILQGVNI